MFEDIGEQNIDIKEIFLFEKLQELFICKGALFSKNYHALSECYATIKFLDFDEKKKDNISIELCNMEYFISKFSLKILVEYELPFNDCFYINMPLFIKTEKLNKVSKITIYFNENNYFYFLLNENIYNSNEFIFYKNSQK
jgi:hypothetical protein